MTIAQLKWIAIPAIAAIASLALFIFAVTWLCNVKPQPTLPPVASQNPDYTGLSYTHLLLEHAYDRRSAATLAYTVPVPRSEAHLIRAHLLHQAPSHGWYASSGTQRLDKPKLLSLFRPGRTVFMTMPQRDLAQLHDLTDDPVTWVANSIAAPPAISADPGPLVNVSLRLKPYFDYTTKPLWLMMSSAMMLAISTPMIFLMLIAEWQTRDHINRFNQGGPPTSPANPAQSPPDSQAAS